MHDILVVEDDDTQAFLMARMLKKAGVRNPTHRGSDGQEALDYLWGRGEYAGREVPGLMLLDLKLPRLSGFDVLRTMKSEERFQHVVVAVITSSVTPSDRETALSQGALAYINKPCTIEALKACLPDGTLQWSEDSD